MTLDEIARSCWTEPGGNVESAVASTVARLKSDQELLEAITAQSDR